MPRPETMSEPARGAWEFVQALNRVWTEQKSPERLADYFHERMVAISPADRQRIEGRAACVAAWKQFVDTVPIHSWTVTDPDVQLFADGRCAVVSYYYTMDVDMRGRRVTLAGRDLFTLAFEHGRWWAVSDQFSPYPAPAGNV